MGAAADSRPVLSVQIRQSSTESAHVTSHLSANRIVLSGDLQRHVRPSFGYGSGWRLDFYGGLGLEGASERDTNGDETYRLRLPVGAECDLRETGVAIFAEGAGTIGPIPKTELGAVAMAGLRSLF